MKVDIDTSDKLYADAWLGFKGTDWKNEINVRDFIQHNYTPYEGDESFLAEATPATTELWEKVMEGIRIENATHAPVDFDTNIATTITAHDAGYINQPLEKIVGLQTDAPLKRALHPFGGINMIKSSFHAYGREMDSEFEYLFTDLRKTHNQGVFDVYSPDMLRCRKSGVLTGLPDGYGRGRIIGDYRRVALYGISYLVRERELQFADLQSRLEKGEDLEATIRLREELAEHRHALLQIQEMAAKYGFDISRPAQNAQEAVQWLYFAYLAAVKSQNGGAMSLGRTASFLDIYIERDFKAGVLNEQQAQELIDHFIMKIRMVRFLRTPEFDSLFSGDPIWATEVIGGMGPDGRRAGTPFAPGANPMHGRDRKGAVASLTSVAKLPFTYAKDGISYTFSIVPAALGKEDPVRKTNLVGLLDGYFHHEADVEGGQHLNVNVMNREMLLDAIEHPEKYPNLTIRVSGYAVRFNALTREQQQDVISRTFTQAL
ncbi:pyruvate formate lyase family protein [Escherichia coli]|uniref:pyruvate formate lyase family protein n=1 Tax=Escherichia coli TaxID=562 RepID=UPI0010808812|nr:pyruvate formate lyase family protein [Escherichia coli]EFK6794041.1 formate acetyltransferase [Escherichia coli]TGG25811.1 formate acetyltransferase [Escherichia coli]TGG32755.1 formate acetyltransferase [Escherichia coli]